MFEMDIAPKNEIVCKLEKTHFVVDLHEDNFKFIKVDGQIKMNISYMNKHLSLAPDEFCINQYYNANDGRVVFCHDQFEVNPVDMTNNMK